MLFFLVVSIRRWEPIATWDGRPRNHVANTYPGYPKIVSSELLARRERRAVACLWAVSAAR